MEDALEIELEMELEMEEIAFEIELDSELFAKEGNEAGEDCDGVMDAADCDAVES